MSDQLSASPKWKCACCGEQGDGFDLLIEPVASGTQHKVSSLSRRGHDALVQTLTFVALTVNDEMLPQVIDAFIEQGLRVARPADGRDTAP